MLRLALLLGEDRVNDQRIGVVENFYIFLLHICLFELIQLCIVVTRDI